MKTLLTSLTALALLAGTALADNRPAPKNDYNDAEYTDLLNASSAAGALAGCDKRDVYRNEALLLDEEAVRRFEAIFGPHFGEATKIGSYAQFSVQLFNRSMQGVLYVLTPRGDGKYDSTPTMIDTAEKCKAVEGTLLEYMKPGAVLDVATGPQQGA